MIDTAVAEKSNLEILKSDMIDSLGRTPQQAYSQEKILGYRHKINLLYPLEASDCEWNPELDPDFIAAKKLIAIHKEKLAKNGRMRFSFFDEFGIFHQLFNFNMHPITFLTIIFEMGPLFKIRDELSGRRTDVSRPCYSFCGLDTVRFNNPDIQRMVKDQIPKLCKIWCDHFWNYRSAEAFASNFEGCSRIIQVLLSIAFSHCAELPNLKMSPRIYDPYINSRAYYDIMDMEGDVGQYCGLFLKLSNQYPPEARKEMYETLKLPNGEPLSQKCNGRTMLVTPKTLIPPLSFPNALLYVYRKMLPRTDKINLLPSFDEWQKEPPTLVPTLSFLPHSPPSLEEEKKNEEAPAAVESGDGDDEDEEEDAILSASKKIKKIDFVKLPGNCKRRFGNSGKNDPKFERKTVSQMYVEYITFKDLQETRGSHIAKCLQTLGDNQQAVKNQLDLTSTQVVNFIQMASDSMINLQTKVTTLEEEVTKLKAGFQAPQPRQARLEEFQFNNNFRRNGTIHNPENVDEFEFN